ncbi:hypothetical protein I4U23_020610 [Adineta vaga]|nr:hypothetical protein I4U23_020610 [Adineta vaga]
MATSVVSKDSLKILLVGDSNTGKDCYVRRLQHGVLTDSDPKTNKCYTISIQIRIVENTNVSVQLTKIPGSKRGRTEIQKYFKTMDGFIVMFDETCPTTYDNVIGWATDIRKINSSNDAPFMVLANKHFETSTTQNINIEESIKTLCHEIIRRKQLPPDPLPALEIEIQEYTLKVVVIGDVNTGKTAIIRRYVDKTFSTAYRTTDIAGEERFHGVMPLFYRETAGCLIVYDVTKPLSLTRGAVKWKNDFDQKINFSNDTPIPCLLIGNKCDLTKDTIFESDNLINELCQTHKFDQCYVTSAKNNTHIDEVFSSLLDRIMENIDSGKVRRRTISATLQPTETSPSKINLATCCN